jgi:hypothetical protein
LFIRGFSQLNGGNDSVFATNFGRLRAILACTPPSGVIDDGTMNDSIEADLLAAHLAPFARDQASWTDAYVTSMSRLDSGADPQRVEAAALAAWRTHGWVHPAVVAHLEQALGPLAAD